MSSTSTAPVVSRRTALAGLGAGGLGLTLAAATRHATAQDSATPTTTNFTRYGHPIVGTWQMDNDPAVPGTNITSAIIDEDGTYIEYTSFNGFSIGTWRPTGERSVDLFFIIQGIESREGPAAIEKVFEPGYVPEGNVFGPEMSVWRLSIMIDETGNTFTAAGEFEAFNAEGAVVYAQDYEGTGFRMVVEPSVAAATPTA